MCLIATYWGEPERAPQNGSAHAFDCSQKIYVSNVDSVILAMQRERKLEQRDLDKEKSLTGLENKEKCGNATKLTRGLALHVVPCDSK